MIIEISPQEFCQKRNFTYKPKDHHHTGPARYHQPEGHGSVFYEEGQILANYAARLGGDVLETGTNLGISARFISDGLDKHGGDGKVYTIDINQWWATHPEWPRIVPFCMDSAYFPKRKFVWAFIDGDHYYNGVVADIKLAIKCGCNPIVMHDGSEAQQIKPGRTFGPGMGCDVIRAIEDTVNPNQWDVYRVGTGSGLMVLELTGVFNNCSYYS